MQAVGFLQDIAIVMIVSGLVTVLFHRLKQPVVLGYILAGLIIGPHTPPFPLIHDQHTIEVMAELGVILLMFGLGLHFSLKDLARVGSTAFVAASLEIMSMLAIGYGIGQIFGWGKLDSLFLGAILSISSTTIITKALQELGLTREKFARLIFGILIVEDILAIAMLAVLSGVATTGSLTAGDIIETLGKLTVFLAFVLVVGLLAVPRALRYIDRFRNNEVLLVASLGVCFGVSLLAHKLGYSVALGAFLAGAVVGEAREHGKIEKLVEPVRDMFSAVFFVAIGMMIEPALLTQYVVPIIVITLAVVLGKVITCSIGTFVTGHSPRTSLKVGMGLAQIGEFSFIIASLGLSLGVISKFLYPIAVTVSALTTLFTPYLIRGSDRIVVWLENRAPQRMVSYMNSYGRLIRREGTDSATVSPPLLPPGIKRMLRRWGIMTGLNLLLLTGLFIAAPYIAVRAEALPLGTLPSWTGGVRGFVWLIAGIAALPLIIVTVQKLRAGSMLLAELWTTASDGSGASPTSPRAQAVIGRTMFIIGSSLLGLWIVILSLAVLPPWPVALLFLCLVGLLAMWRWKAFARLYAKGEAALTETLADDSVYAISAIRDDDKRPLPPALKEAEILSISLKPGSPAVGKLLREIELRSRTGASAVAIEREGADPIVNPGPDEELLAGDRVLLLGNQSQIKTAKALLEGA